MAARGAGAASGETGEEETGGRAHKEGTAATREAPARNAECSVCATQILSARNRAVRAKAK